MCHRPLLAVTDDLDLFRVGAESLQKVGNGMGPFLAQSQIVSNRAALVTVAFELHNGIRMGEKIFCLSLQQALISLMNT